ncbi:hypothetical protein EYF80_046914 [Liparis tanakae]|uniref:Uncharacterized protein n=1 Tax=Liparis tanakae TaxID=230148 RepID=A0A4Z2FPD7_9TELE|nr:hypothetical protein EYF80_046914 [Liparis tanakae]
MGERKRGRRGRWEERGWEKGGEGGGRMGERRRGRREDGRKEEREEGGEEEGNDGSPEETNMVSLTRVPWSSKTNDTAGTSRSHPGSGGNNNRYGAVIQSLTSPVVLGLQRTRRLAPPRRPGYGVRSTALSCTALSCTALSCTTLHRPAVHRTALSCTAPTVHQLQPLRA